MATYDFHALQNGSDIRGVAIDGVAGESVNLTEEVTARIAKGFLIWLTEKTGKDPYDMVITIGRDPRLSGEKLLNAFTGALLPLGVQAIDCGLASTPAMFMSTVFPEIQADGAVMVTASHLPYNRNGLKFFSKDGGLDKADIKAILENAGDDEILNRIPEGKGVSGHTDTQELMELYTAHLRSLIQDAIPGDHPLSGLNIAIDCGNGAGGFYVDRVLKPLGADTSSSRYLNPDGSFPNHIPNPENEEAMAAITDAVRKGGCDLGIIFDTDVDRSSAVDENGREINRNGIVAMAAALIAEDYPGTTVVTDSITSNELTEYLQNTLKLKHFRFKRGYRNVINKAMELNNAGTDSQLAIETSGHAAYRENFFLDDGAYLATKIIIRLAQLHRDGRKISSVIADLKEPEEAMEIRMPITSDDHNAAGNDILEQVKAWANMNQKRDNVLSDSAEKPLAMTLVQPNYEGVRVQFSGAVNGWFLLRKSLHDPIMPLNIEANELGGCRVIASLLYDFLKDVDGLDTGKLGAITQ